MLFSLGRQFYRFTLYNLQNNVRIRLKGKIQRECRTPKNITRVQKSVGLSRSRSLWQRSQENWSMSFLGYSSHFFYPYLRPNCYRFKKCYLFYISIKFLNLIILLKKIKIQTPPYIYIYILLKIFPQQDSRIF